MTSRPLLALGIGLVLAGCSLAPRYVPPVVQAPVSFGTTWQQATPADADPHGNWWEVYGDTRLDTLERRLTEASPDLGIATARYDEARALATEAAAGLFPSVNVGALSSRDRQSDNRPLRSTSQPATYRDYLAGASASYELDFWGRLRSQATAGRAAAAASAADVRTARLSLTAELAADYVALAGVDAESRLLDATTRAYESALHLVNTRHDGGLASGLDVARAESQLRAADAQRTDLSLRRELLVHAIARLVGAPASGFSIEPIEALPHVPSIPPGIPSLLAQRRPDIAADERRVAAANAAIGLARAAYFPRFTLTALAGYESTGATGWITAPNRLWAIGPNMAASVFDAGAHGAEVARARAALRESTEHYRGTVLSAFREIEDALSQLGGLADEERQQQAATDAARRALALSSARYDAGAISYLDVVVAEATSLQAERTLLAIQVRRLGASVTLIRGLGGTWNDAESRPSPAGSELK